MKNIINKNKIKSLKKKVFEIIDFTVDYIPAYINTDFLINKNWVAVPIEKYDNDYFYKFTLALFKSASNEGQSYSLAIPVEKINDDDFYEMELSKEDLNNFMDYCFVYGYTILSEKMSFVILVTFEDYFIIASQKKIIEAVINCKVEHMLERYRVWAAGWPDNFKKLENFLLSVYEKYKIHNALIN